MRSRTILWLLKCSGLENPVATPRRSVSLSIYNTPGISFNKRKPEEAYLPRHDNDTCFAFHSPTIPGLLPYSFVPPTLMSASVVDRLYQTPCSAWTPIQIIHLLSLTQRDTSVNRRQLFIRRFRRRLEFGQEFEYLDKTCMAYVNERILDLNSQGAKILVAKVMSNNHVHP